MYPVLITVVQFPMFYGILGNTFYLWLGGKKKIYQFLMPIFLRLFVLFCASLNIPPVSGLFQRNSKAYISFSMLITTFQKLFNIYFLFSSPIFPNQHETAIMVALRSDCLSLGVLFSNQSEWCSYIYLLVVSSCT